MLFQMCAYTQAHMFTSCVYRHTQVLLLVLYSISPYRHKKFEKKDCLLKWELVLQGQLHRLTFHSVLTF